MILHTGGYRLGVLCGLVGNMTLRAAVITDESIVLEAEDGRRFVVAAVCEGGHAQLKFALEPSVRA